MRINLYTFAVLLTFSLHSMRLRFILENNTEANLFACLRTHDCNPMDEAVMPPGTRENIYTENFSSQVTHFRFNLRTNTEATYYEVVYHPKAKILELQREGLSFGTIPYNAAHVTYPVVIQIDKRLDAYFHMEALLENGKINGMNKPNRLGYKPSLYLGNSGPYEPRADKNRFCSRHSKYRYDLVHLTSYAGIGETPEPHDNLNPFCRKKRRHVRLRSSCGEKCS